MSGRYHLVYALLPPPLLPPPPPPPPSTGTDTREPGGAAAATNGGAISEVDDALTNTITNESGMALSSTTTSNIHSATNHRGGHE